jgi:NAD+ synthase
MEKLSYTSTLDIGKAKAHIVQWMKDYMDKTGLKGWVIGVSGGVDSALVSTLCAETGHHLLCVEMPIHQNKEHATRAMRHIEWLKKNYDNVDSIELELTNTFEAMVSEFEKGTAQIPWATPDETNELALANTRSRLRMTGLYYYANMLQRLVCGTGNKVEDFGVGFCTKGGDQIADISPVADLLKSEVREMARVMGINDEIINAVPSDGLWEDTRSDEEQIGAAYDELEWAMAYLDDEPAGNGRSHLSERQQKVLEIYTQRHDANRHKMDPIPVCDISELRG